jgi:hypothetical protein
MRIIRSLSTIATTLLLIGLCRMPGATAGEEQSIQAFSAFEAEGQVLTTGPNEATYIGMLTGRLYIDTGQGPVDAGSIACPIVLHINLKGRTERGSGECALAGAAGNQAYFDLTCTGVPLVGCSGASTLNGGTGRFANATGGGAFVLRSSLHEFEAKADSTVTAKSTGIIFWRELHYKIP